jgi:RNA polymerase sigma factor (sigma-70 family)
MTDAPDAELLRQFTRNRSEAAFATLVERHLALVYSAALRHTADPQSAQDIAQAVFLILARKAGSLGRNPALAGWLYHTARLTAANWRRAETRRIHREQEAYMEAARETAAPDAAWRELAPLLDEAMGRLSAADRDALVLRYFQNQSLAAVGGALGLGERAAQKRVARALEKLRGLFARRGVRLPLTLIAGAMSAYSAQAAPAGLAKMIATAAVAPGAAAGTATLTLVKGALKMMAWNQIKTVAVAGVSVLLAAGLTSVAVKNVRSKTATAASPTAANAYPGDWIWEPNASTLKRVPPIFLLRPSTLPAASLPFDLFGEGRFLARGKTIQELLATVWSQKNSSLKLLYPADLPDDKYDIIATDPKHWPEALKLEINRRFHLIEQIETRDGTPVVVVKNAG